ncbi:MAG: hypothetical protein KC586_27565, partial [Myxococcales bacterium]|nr:hypothetical protein [Myxococcales bacterium]
MFDLEDHAWNELDDSADHEDESFDAAPFDAAPFDAVPFDAVAAEEELATLSSHLDAATYRQLVLIRQLDESG